MPVFGQVWLWSLLAFLLGTALCWLVAGQPARRRVAELERTLARMRAKIDASPSAEVTAGEDRVASGVGDSGPAESPAPGRDNRDYDPGPETLTRAYAMPGIRDPAPLDEAAERGALWLSPTNTPDEVPQNRASQPQQQETTPAGSTQYLGVLGAPLGKSQPFEDRPATTGRGARGWFEDKREGEKTAHVPSPATARRDRHALDTRKNDDDGGGTIYTEHTSPAPAKAARQPDGVTGEFTSARAPRSPSSTVAGPTGARDRRGGLGSDTGTARPDPTSSEPTGTKPPRTRESTYQLGEKGMPRVSRVEAATSRRPAGAGANPGADSQSKAARGTVGQPERASSLLPKRVPSKPQKGHPFGVQTVSPATATTTSGGERTRALFEPIVPVEGAASSMPPPHRLRKREGQTGSASPFGSGSALPLPGGASPSPEFTVKASVAAMRYCTQESSQFGRTVAEVWFRAPADAERAGFRPLT
jgi:hypothetical protein